MRYFKTRTADRRRILRWGTWKAQRGRCAYCMKSITIDEATIDHVVPKSRGGTGAAHNCVVACAPCNHAKGDRTLEEWRADKRQQ